MTASKKPDLVSVEDYLAGEEQSDIKHEYLGGVIHAMAGGTNDHAAVATNAGGSLVPQLRGKPCRTFGSDAKLKIEFPDHIRFYYPDLQVVCRPNPGSDPYPFQEHPVLVVEVEEYTGRDSIIALPEVEAELPFVELYEGIAFA